MKFVKKILLTLIFALWLSYSLNWVCLWASNDFYYDKDEVWEKRRKEGSLDTDYWRMIKENTVTEESSLLNEALKIFNLDENSNEKYTWPKKALAYAIYLINYALGFVAFIALCLLIYSFYCVVVGDQKQIDKAKSYLKWIAIAIVVMGLSWLITSLIFWLYDDVAKDEGATLTMTQTFTFNA